MKKTILILALFHLALTTSAQTLLSNKISTYSALYERIDFYDEEGSKIVSLAPRFYKHKELKKRMKPIKVMDQTYYIRIEKFGVQSVYTDTGEHVADMERNGTTIHFLQDGSTYSLRPILKFINPNILECYNSEGTLVSKISQNSDRKLTYDANGEEDSKLLLMSLCAHQYQELLLGERGRLSSGTNMLLFSISD